MAIVASVLIADHERGEALEVYFDWLTLTQREAIIDAPEGAVIRIELHNIYAIAIYAIVRIAVLP